MLTFSAHTRTQVYLVQGIAQPLAGPLLGVGMKNPFLLRLTLLAFRGRIVYDGLLIAPVPKFGMVLFLNRLPALDLSHYFEFRIWR